MKKKTPLSVLTNGIIKENPVLVLVLGTCPTLATTNTVNGAFGMGIAALVVLLCSNVFISLLRKVIPETMRIPCYIVIIAGFVTIVKMLVQGFLPSLYESLGVYLDLITVNCIILGRAEMFANRNTVAHSALDGIGMGILRWPCVRWRLCVKCSAPPLLRVSLFLLWKRIKSSF